MIQIEENIEFMDHFIRRKRSQKGVSLYIEKLPLMGEDTAPVYDKTDVGDYILETETYNKRLSCGGNIEYYLVTEYKKTYPS